MLIDSPQNIISYAHHIDDPDPNLFILGKEIVKNKFSIFKGIKGEIKEPTQCFRLYICTWIQDFLEELKKKKRHLALFSEFEKFRENGKEVFALESL